MDVGYLWDEDKYELVQQKHNVVFFEVVSAMDDPNSFEVPAPSGHADRWMCVGRSVTDRILTVIYSEEDLPVYRLITAFDAEKRWVDEYYEKQG